MTQGTLVIRNQVSFMLASVICLMVDRLVTSFLLIFFRMEFSIVPGMQKAVDGIKLYGSDEIDQQEQKCRTACES
jgi:hypothetical protein